MNQTKQPFTGVIYKLTFPNGKIYIGQTVNYERRINRYKILDCKSQMKLYRAITKYGWDNVKAEIIKQCFNSEDLDNSEEELIEQYDCRNESKGYNIAPGGRGGSDWTYRRKQAKLQTGLKRTYIFTDAHRRKIGEANKRRDRKIYEEIAKKCSRTLTGRKVGPHREETKKKIGQGNRGKKRTSEQNLKNSEAQKKYHKENPMSRKQREKISKGNRGKIRTKEQRKRYSEAAKKRWAKQKD